MTQKRELLFLNYYYYELKKSLPIRYSHSMGTYHVMRIPLNPW